MRGMERLGKELESQEEDIVRYLREEDIVRYLRDVMTRVGISDAESQPDGTRDDNDDSPDTEEGRAEEHSSSAMRTEEVVERVAFEDHGKKMERHGKMIESQGREIH